MFSIGDYVVKPNTGICEIQEIVTMSLSGDGEKPYYVLIPIDSAKSKMFVAVGADRKRIRSVMTKDEASDLMGRIPEINQMYVPSDKLREQQYKEAFKSNEAEELVKLIKGVYIRSNTRQQQGKKITSTDEKYLRQAEKALFSELTFILGETSESIQKVIMETLK